MQFRPTEWTNAFLDELATNKMTLSNRQSRRKIKEVLDKLGHITRAQMINLSKAAAKEAQEVLSTPQSELACTQELCNMHKLKADAAQRQIRSL